jgi:Flp pilus assembly protein TadG
MISKLMRVIQKDQAGQSLVEVALSVPLLLLLLTGGAEFACMAYATIEVTGAAKAAVQYGAQELAFTNDTGGMQNAVNSEVMDVPGLTGATLQTPTTSLSCADGSSYSATGCSGSSTIHTLNVTTKATFTPWAIVNPLLKVCNLPTSFPLTGYATQVVLQ